MAEDRRKGAVLKLTGQLCTLRPWQRGDATALVRHANNVNVAKSLRDRFPHPYTRIDAAGFLAHAVAANPPTSFAIEVESEAVGGIGYIKGTDIERYSAEVGYWLSEAFWGRGIVTEALQLLSDHLLSEVGLLRLFALPLADNPGSIRVLEKAGYEREGRLRASCVKYGERRDQILFARIHPAWPGPRSG